MTICIRTGAILCVDGTVSQRRTLALAVTPARRTLPETSSPYPPSSTTWNQHGVMRSIDAVCACTPYWTYTLRIGVEPIRAVHARPVGLAPPRGCARLPRHRLPARLSQEDCFSSLPPGCEYPAHATLWLNRLLCAE